MTPKAIEEVRGVEELIYRQFLIAIVLQDGVRRKASKKLQKTLQKVWKLKTKALLLHPLSKRKASNWFWGFENKFWKNFLKKRCEKIWKYQIKLLIFASAFAPENGRQTNKKEIVL